MKIAKIAKNENFEEKLKMPLGQNVGFGISGNLAKLVFSKILSWDRVVMSYIFYAGVGIVYIVHLLSPLIILRSHFLIIPFMFYFVFHFLAFGVGISFTANLVIWLGFLNIKNIKEGVLPYYGYR